VREILADPLARAEAGLDRRVDRRALAHVGERVVDAGADVAHQRQRVAAVRLVEPELAGQRVEQRRAARVLARHQHLPEIAFADDAGEIRPGGGRQRRRQLRHRFEVDQRVGDDRQLAVVLRQVEVVHLVAEMILERKDPGPRVDREPEGEAALHRLAERVHPHFHHALPDRPAVAETGEMTNRVEHQPPQLSNATSTG
jgi:hypothetical protein